MSTSSTTPSRGRATDSVRLDRSDLDHGFATIECRNPATLEYLGEVPVFTREMVKERVARARAAQVAWGATSFRKRRAVMRRLLDYIVDHQEEICRLCSRDSGKTLVDAAMGEIFPVCEKIRSLIAHGERDLTPEPRESGLLQHKRVRVEWRPLGVIGVICPWNFPFHNIFCPVVPALFAGNAVVVKVSELTSWSAADFQAIFDEVLRAEGLSTDLVQIVTGAGETGSALVTSGVDKIFFTGSPQNGKKVMAAASETLTPVVLELGGKDPMIICDDADLDQAADTAMLGVFTACGQMCVGAERLYVFESVYDQFVEKVVARVAALRQGPPTEDLGGQYDVGAMTMARQLEIIGRHVEDAVRKGARVLVGGRRNPNWPGQFWEPTVLVDVTHDMDIVREETFGPVMTIIKVRDEEEAIRLANDTPYGLGSSLFTKSARRAERIQARISAGMTVVNDYGIAYMMQSAPFGGVRISGFGKINGREGLRACCLEKTVVTDRVPIRKGMSFYPIQKSTYPMLEGAVGVLYGGGMVRKARAAWQLGRSLLALAKGKKLAK
jgi:acyl-CoA reductase-like NAD-dependent aldehyde dehydrogenase